MTQIDLTKAIEVVRLEAKDNFQFATSLEYLEQIISAAQSQAKTLAVRQSNHDYQWNPSMVGHAPDDGFFTKPDLTDAKGLCAKSDCPCNKVEVQASEAQTPLFTPLDELDMLEIHFQGLLEGYANKMEWYAIAARTDNVLASFKSLRAALQRPSVNDDTLIREALEAMQDCVARYIQLANTISPVKTVTTAVSGWRGTIAKLKERLDK